MGFAAIVSGILYMEIFHVMDSADYWHSASRNQIASTVNNKSLDQVNPLRFNTTFDVTKLSQDSKGSESSKLKSPQDNLTSIAYVKSHELPKDDRHEDPEKRPENAPSIIKEEISSSDGLTMNKSESHDVDDRQPLNSDDGTSFLAAAASSPGAVSPPDYEAGNPYEESRFEERKSDSSDTLRVNIPLAGSVETTTLIMNIADAGFNINHHNFNEGFAVAADAVHIPVTVSPAIDPRSSDPQ